MAFKKKETKRGFYTTSSLILLYVNTSIIFLRTLVFDKKQTSIVPIYPLKMCPNVVRY